MAETIASMAVKIGVDLSGFQKDMAEFKKSFGRLGSQVQSAGTKIGTSFTAAGGAIAVGLGLAVNKAAEFDSEMSRVGAIAGATGDDFKAMRQTALDLGASTSKSASEVAQGMELMAAKGYDANQVIAAMPGVISAAEASGQDMALVADTVASALNAFKLQASDASRVADVLAKSANTSAAGVDDLQLAFKYAAPVFQNAGYSIEQLSAATGIMADAGMKGEQAGTTLRAAMLRLADPPKEAANMMRELGISVTDAAGNFLPFDQILGQLQTSTANMTNAQKSQALSTIFGTEAMTGMLSLVEAGPAKFNALTTELQNAGGASATAAAQMKNNLTGSLQELGGAVETMQISIGSALAPAIRMLADSVSGLVGMFNSLSPSTQQFIAIGSAVSAALLVLVGVVGFLVAGLGALAAAEWAVILPIAGLVGGIALAVAALVAIGVALVQAYQKSETFRNVVNSVWEAIKAGFQALAAFLQPAVDAMMKFATAQFTEFKKFWLDIWPQLSKAFENIWKGIWTVLEPIVNAIVTLMKWAWPLVKLIITETWDSVKKLISGALNIIMGVIKTFASVFTGDWKGVWEGVKQILSGALDLMLGWFELFGIGKLLKAAKFLGGQLGGVFKGMWDEIRVTFSGSLDWIGGLVKQSFDGVLSYLKGIGSMFFDAGKGLIDMMKKGIENAASAVMDSIRSIAKDVRSFLPFSPAKEGPLSDLDKLDFAGPITDSIYGGLPTVQSAMEHLVTLPAMNPLGSTGAAKTANVGSGGVTVLVDLDGHTIARAVGQPLVDLIRVKTGLRI